MCAPPIENATIRVENGIITDVGTSPDPPSGQNTNIRHAKLVTPGFINAHTHLDLSLFNEHEMPVEFIDWIPYLIKKAATIMPSGWQIAVEKGAKISLKSGVTGVIDIDRSGLGLDVLAKSHLRALSLLEIIGGIDRWEQIQTSLDEREDNGLVVTGYSPHSPYSVQPALLARVLEHAGNHAGFAAMHVAESEFERTWCQQGQGPLQEMLAGINAPSVPESTHRSSIDMLASYGALEHISALVHCVDVDSEDIEMIKKSGASIITCTRSNARLKVGKPPIDRFIKAGINVAVGTDSLASTPDLSILNELRFIRKHFPELDPQTIMEMGTVNGGKLLQSSTPLGVIQTGAIGDLCLWDYPSIIIDDPVSLILNDDFQMMLTGVAVNGQIIDAHAL